MDRKAGEFRVGDLVEITGDPHLWTVEGGESRYIDWNTRRTEITVSRIAVRPDGEHAEVVDVTPDRVTLVCPWYERSDLWTMDPIEYERWGAPLNI